MPFNLGGPEMLMIMLVAVLLFGKRLPEVGRSLGRGIVEFKKGIRGIEDEIDASSSSSSSSHSSAPAYRPADDFGASVPKFEPPVATATPAPAAPVTAVPYQD